MRIHHATAKKAKKFKINLTVEDNEVVATSAATGERLASGLQGNKVLEDAITKLTGHPAKGSATVEQPKAKKAKKVVEETDEDETDEDETDEANVEAEEGDEEADARHSAVKAKYKAKYRPTKGRCGDDLGEQITAHVSREQDDGKTGVDLTALRRFAKANGVWVESYASLKNKDGSWNGGMSRMNVGNKLRAKIRRAKVEGKAFEVDWK